MKKIGIALGLLLGAGGSSRRGAAVVSRCRGRETLSRGDGGAQRRQLSVRGDAGAVPARLAGIHRAASRQPQGRPRGLLRHPPRHRSAARPARGPGADALHAALAAAGAGGRRLLFRQAAGADRRHGRGLRAQRGHSHRLACVQPLAAHAARRQAHLGRGAGYAALYRQLEDEARHEHAAAGFRGRRRGGRSDARQPAGRVDHRGQPARLAGRDPHRRRPDGPRKPGRWRRPEGHRDHHAPAQPGPDDPGGLRVQSEGGCGNRRGNGPARVQRCGRWSWSSTGWTRRP